MNRQKTINKYTRLRQKFEKTVMQDNVQAEIKRLRKKWKVPKNGFKRQNASLKWQNWLMEATDHYLDNRDNPLHKKIIKIRKRLDKNKSINIEEDNRTIKDLNKQYNAETPINAFNNDVFQLQQLTNLSDAFKETFKWYLLMGIINSVAGPSITIKKHPDHADKDEMYIRIYPETVLKDIEGMWWMVPIHKERRLGSDHKRLKNQPKLERNKRILSLAQAGHSYSEIAQLINKEFQDNLIYKDVSTIIAKLKKRYS